MKKVVLVTDTWLDNVNGVVNSLIRTKSGLEARGFEVSVIQPDLFRNLPLPTYPEIKISFVLVKNMQEILAQEKPDYIHIATEGSLGLVARAACLKSGWNFTTFYHTRMPDYIYARLKSFRGLTYNYLRWFHNAGNKAFVATQSLKDELESRKFKNLVVAPLGVDTEFFKKNPKAERLPGLADPVFVFLGRIAPEKNIEAFLEADLVGSKLVIGDGPDRIKLEHKYKGQALFTGYKKGQELVDILSTADVLVFPGKTDTFGLVILEALACGLPVAAYDVTGPKDILTPGVDGFLGDDLAENAKKCLTLNPEACRAKSLKFGWDNLVESFIKELVPIK